MCRRKEKGLLGTTTAMLARKNSTKQTCSGRSRARHASTKPNHSTTTRLLIVNATTPPTTFENAS